MTEASKRSSWRKSSMTCPPKPPDLGGIFEMTYLGIFCWDFPSKCWTKVTDIHGKYMINYPKRTDQLCALSITGLTDVRFHHLVSLKLSFHPYRLFKQKWSNFSKSWIACQPLVNWHEFSMESYLYSPLPQPGDRTVCPDETPARTHHGDEKRQLGYRIKAPGVHWELMAKPWNCQLWWFLGGLGVVILGLIWPKYRL